MNDKMISLEVFEVKGNFGWVVVCSLLFFVLLLLLLFFVQYSIVYFFLFLQFLFFDVLVDLVISLYDVVQFMYVDFVIVSGIQYFGLYDSSCFIDKSYEGVEVEIEDDDEIIYLGFCILLQVKFFCFLEEISFDLDCILVCRKFFVFYYFWKFFLFF